MLSPDLSSACNSLHLCQQESRSTLRSIPSDSSASSSTIAFRMIASRHRSPRDVDGLPCARQHISHAQSLREIHITSGAGNIAEPSTSTDVANPMMNTTANFDDVDMPTESAEDSDPESSDSYFDAESQSNDDSLSALEVKEEETDRQMVVRTLAPTSFQIS